MRWFSRSEIFAAFGLSFGLFLSLGAAPAALAKARFAPVPAVREEAIVTTRDEGILRLGLKRYPRPGAVPVLFLHGLAQNDRGWDNPVRDLSFAQELSARGYDVWMGNYRSAGTEGFRSDSPAGAARWTVDSYTTEDAPALIDAVRAKTGQKPFLIGHSLGAWAIEGYLSGVQRSARGRISADPELSELRQEGIRGVITVAGVYSIWWPHSVENAVRAPIRTEDEFYQSNYELELGASSRLLRYWVPKLPSLPLGWVRDALFIPFQQLPVVGPLVGEELEELYRGFQDRVIESPLLSLLFYGKNSDPEMVRQHVKDGLEPISPLILEQLSNVVRHRATLSHYDSLDEEDSRVPGGTYRYASARASIRVPFLFVAGERDRLANREMIREDGYLKMGSPDKTYLVAQDAGHLDVLTGNRVRGDVFLPVAEWIAKRDHSDR